ncbi:unnamed protein product [Diplocarpon coronariae]
MHSSDFECILSSEYHIGVEFVPGLSSVRHFRLSTASFGPGSLAIGLKYSR